MIKSEDYDYHDKYMEQFNRQKHVLMYDITDIKNELEEMTEDEEDEAADQEIIKIKKSIK